MRGDIIMGITLKTKDKIVKFFRAGYSCEEISETMMIPVDIVKQIISWQR